MSLARCQGGSVVGQALRFRTVDAISSPELAWGDPSDLQSKISNGSEAFLATPCTRVFGTNSAPNTKQVTSNQEFRANTSGHSIMCFG